MTSKIRKAVLLVSVLAGTVGFAAAQDSRYYDSDDYRYENRSYDRDDYQYQNRYGRDDYRDNFRRGLHAKAICEPIAAMALITTDEGQGEGRKAAGEPAAF